MIQFIIEAVIVSVSGVFLGIVFGIIISQFVSTMFGWNTTITIQSVALATFFSLSVGIIFGIWPAKKASELEPKDALRFE